MYYNIEDSPIAQDIHAFSATQLAETGRVVRAVDALFGMGEFMYMPGVASTAVGDAILINPYLATTTRCPATGGVGLIGIAMSANILTTTYGFYQISGAAVIRANGAVAAAALLYMAATGAVDDAVVAGEIIFSAYSATASGWTITKTCQTTNGGTVLQVPNTAGLFIGMTPSGTGIAASTITAIDVAGRLVTLSAAMTATGSVTVTFTGTNYVVGGIQRPAIQ